LTGADLISAGKECAKSKAKEANRKGKANALLKLSQYADKDYQWAYRNLPQAKKDGVVFFQDVDSVWCACMGNNQGVGSSTEQAHTEGK
jgi:hypothetical protein